VSTRTPSAPGAPPAVRSADPVAAAFARERALPGSALAEIDLNARDHRRLGQLGFTYLGQPLFMDRAEIAAFGGDLMRVVALLRDLPFRMFDADVARTCAALGIDPAKARLIKAFSRQPALPFGRIDAYHDGESLKILEFNATSAAGGQEWVSDVSAEMLAFPSFRAFADRHGLTYVDTGEVLARDLRAAAARITGGSAPVVAVVEGRGGLRTYGRAWYPLREILREHGFTCHIGEIDDLRFVGGRVYCGDAAEPVDIVYRVFDLAQVVADPASLRAAESLRDAHEDGSIVLWTPLETEIHRNKRWLAILSDPRRGAPLSVDERALVDRVLPWTRELTKDTERDDPGLWSVLSEHRAELVVKPFDGFGGRGITYGWLVDDEQWCERLRTAAADGAVVQRRVVPRPEHVYDPATGAMTAWDACWGMFWTPSGFAGAGARLVPAGSPVTVDRSAKRMAGLFLHGAEQSGAEPHGAGPDGAESHGGESHGVRHHGAAGGEEAA
jgi:hypothetical protein